MEEALQREVVRILGALSSTAPMNTPVNGIGVTHPGYSHRPTGFDWVRSGARHRKLMI